MAARSLDIASPPAGRLRKWISLGIASYLIWQTILPLRYYLGHDRRDERFAWRIFSTLTVPSYRCEVHVQEFSAPDGPPGREVNLEPVLHDAWIGLLKLGQDVVAERLLQARCRSDRLVEAVEFSRTCHRADGKPAPHMRVRLDCRSGDLRTREEMQ